MGLLELLRRMMVRHRDAAAFRKKSKRAEMVQFPI